MGKNNEDDDYDDDDPYRELENKAVSYVLYSILLLSNTLWLALYKKR